MHYRHYSTLVPVFMLLSLSGPSLASAQRAEQVYTDPAKTDADFAYQGEFAGKITAEGGTQDAGAQVVALGSGKFHLVLYRGGLPGAGWKKPARKQADGQLQQDAVHFMLDRGEADLTVGTLRVKDAEGNFIGELKRVERKSPTLGKQSPRGAIVLFDGKSAEAFQGGKLTQDGLLQQGATSKQTFQDYTLHVEFRTPYMPTARDQGRGNSGCYQQGRYEVQILDSFGLEGKDNECGGIYSIRPPDVNMCLPPLAWQTYDIDYTAARFDAAGKKTKNARITVSHNGVVVHKDVELPKATTAAPVPEGPSPGPVFLQDHGNPVRFRNVWLVERGSAAK